jgi:hypothetical protein
MAESRGSMPNILGALAAPLVFATEAYDYLARGLAEKSG